MRFTFSSIKRGSIFACWTRTRVQFETLVYDFSLYSDLISIMTGGDAEIQDIQPYYGNEEGYFGKDLTEIDFSRNAKTVTVKPKK